MFQFLFLIILMIYVSIYTQRYHNIFSELWRMKYILSLTPCIHMHAKIIYYTLLFQQNHLYGREY